MHFYEHLSVLSRQLEDFLRSLNDEQYGTPLPEMQASSIGQHTRHILEFFTELISGYHSGHVDYDGRRRDRALETDRFRALETLHDLQQRIRRPDKVLVLLVSYGPAGAPSGAVATTYHRELSYAIDHMVHHMALLRIAALFVSAPVLPASFGLAAATQRYQQLCAR